MYLSIWDDSDQTNEKYRKVLECQDIRKKNRTE